MIEAKAGRTIVRAIWHRVTAYGGANDGLLEDDEMVREARAYRFAFVQVGLEVDRRGHYSNCPLIDFLRTYRGLYMSDR